MWRILDCVCFVRFVGQACGIAEALTRRIRSLHYKACMYATMHDSIVENE